MSQLLQLLPLFVKENLQESLPLLEKTAWLANDFSSLCCNSLLSWDFTWATPLLFTKNDFLHSLQCALVESPQATLEIQLYSSSHLLLYVVYAICLNFLLFFAYFWKFQYFMFFYDFIPSERSVIKKYEAFRTLSYIMKSATDSLLRIRILIFQNFNPLIYGVYLCDVCFILIPPI